MAVTQSLTLTESTIDAATNTSKVRILWKSTQTGASWNGYTKTAEFYVSINGGTETRYTANYTLPMNTTNTIVDTTITVAHKPDGSGNVTVRTWMDTGISAGVVTKTASLTLTTIPRETTLDSLVLTGGSLNGTINVNYTPKKSSFYNKYIVYVNVNKLLTQIRTDALNSGTTQQTYPLKFTADELATIYSKVSNSSSATIRVTIQTYLDNTCKTKIGSDQSREITTALPSSVAPTAVLTEVPVNTNTWVASVRDNGEEIYVAGLSGATVILAANPGTGAQPDTASITYDGTTVNTTFNTTLNVKALNKAGEIKFKAKVVDSRGRSTTVEKPITVRSYSSPTVTSMNVERGKYNNDGSWETNATGGDVRVKFRTTLSLNDEGNVYTAAFKIDNKEPTQLVGTISGLKSGVERTVYFVGVDGDKSHTLKLTATDKVGNVGVATITIPTTHITVEYNANGKGIAFGKTSEKDAFECAMDAEFSGSLAKKLEDNSLLEIDDTGWISMGTSSSVSTGTDTGRNGPGCYYRVINKCHVYVVFNAGFTFSGSAITVNGTALPTELRPKRKAYAMNLVSGRAVARTGVNIYGNVVIDWVQNIASAAPTESASTTWIDGYVDYWI